MGFFQKRADLSKKGISNNPHISIIRTKYAKNTKIWGPGGSKKGPKIGYSRDTPKKGPKYPQKGVQNPQKGGVPPKKGSKIDKNGQKPPKSIKTPKKGQK